MNSRDLAQKLMQAYFDYWLARCYPRLNTQAFSALLAKAREWELPTEELQYWVLGCGYLSGQESGL